MSFFDIFSLNYWKQKYEVIKYFIYLFFYSIFYPPPKERRDVGSNWGGTSYHNYDRGGGGSSGSGSGGRSWNISAGLGRKPSRYFIAAYLSCRRCCRRRLFVAEHTRRIHTVPTHYT